MCKVHILVIVRASKDDLTMSSSPFGSNSPIQKRGWRKRLIVKSKLAEVAERQGLCRPQAHRLLLQSLNIACMRSSALASQHHQLVCLSVGSFVWRRGGSTEAGKSAHGAVVLYINVANILWLALSPPVVLLIERKPCNDPIHITCPMHSLRSHPRRLRKKDLPSLATGYPENFPQLQGRNQGGT